MRKFILTLLLTSLSLLFSASVPPAYQIALLKYSGGGDWYANPTSLPNLVKFANSALKTNISAEVATVDAGSPDINNYPYIHLTGHGNVIFSDQELSNLRNYLIAGGFLHIDDNYGMDKYIRPQIKRIFPELDLIELPNDHPIYHQQFSFPEGLPKIHEHDNKVPQGLGIVFEGRLVVFYTFECDLGDGWEDPDVHNDSEPTRQKALRMGANILQYIFTSK